MFNYLLRNSEDREYQKYLRCIVQHGKSQLKVWKLNCKHQGWSENAQCGVQSLKKETIKKVQKNSIEITNNIEFKRELYE